jgi:histidine kinase-like protein
VSDKRRALLLEVPSERPFLELVREVARKMAETAGFSASVADDVSVAVDEATAQATGDGSGKGAGRRVEVAFEDRGPEFCVDVTGDAAVGPGENGHRMERVMDSVTFRGTSGHRVCCLVKRKAGSRA